MTKKILITGACGFIGFHLSKALLDLGYGVDGIDNFNSYYPVQLKIDRLKILDEYPDFINYNIDLTNKTYLDILFADNKYEIVVNLAAQAGVRHSILAPYDYLNSNLTGFLNILEACRHNSVKHLIYASSSSVYGRTDTEEFSVGDKIDTPMSLYAATKASNELMSYSYSSLYGIPITGLRFFTVYGTWGRPDMMLWKTTKAILEGTDIEVYNNGNMFRDFTHVSDIVKGVIAVINKTPSETPPHKIYNLGNNKPEKLSDFIEEIEKALNKKAKIVYKPIAAGDVMRTCCALGEEREFFNPTTTIQTGIPEFCAWYKEYHKIAP